jgi:hypothetical protein
MDVRWVVHGMQKVFKIFLGVMQFDDMAPLQHRVAVRLWHFEETSEDFGIVGQDRLMYTEELRFDMKDDRAVMEPEAFVS